MYAAAALGRARGAQRHAPAVVYDDMQACELGGRVDRPSFSRISHWLLSSSWAADRRTFLTSLAGVRRNFPAARHSAERGAFIQYDRQGSSLSVVHSTPCQHVSRRLADMVQHLSIALSKSGSSAGFKPSWKDLTFEAEPLSPDDKIHD